MNGTYYEVHYEAFSTPNNNNNNNNLDNKLDVVELAKEDVVEVMANKNQIEQELHIPSVTSSYPVRFHKNYN